MKLTKTQKTILEEMKQELELIKKYDTFEKYLEIEIKPKFHENWKFEDWQMRYLKEDYENAQNNIVEKKANTKTFEKLVSLGLIEVIEYKENQRDLIKVLN